MNLTTRLDELIRACFTGLWIQSFEHEDAALDIARLCHTHQWRFAAWDVDRGLALANDSTAAPTKDPLAVLRCLAPPGGKGRDARGKRRRFVASAIGAETGLKGLGGQPGSTSGHGVWCPRSYIIVNLIGTYIIDLIGSCLG